MLLVPARLNYNFWKLIIDCFRETLRNVSIGGVVELIVLLTKKFKFGIRIGCLSVLSRLFVESKVGCFVCV